MPYTTLVSGTTITAAWANANVRDQTVTPFASWAARDSAISSPVAGMVVYGATGDIQEGISTRNSAGQWRTPWNQPWGDVGAASSTSIQSGITTTTTDLTGLTITFTAVANRIYEITGKLLLEKATNAGGGEIDLTTGANVLIHNLVNQKMGIGDIQFVTLATRVTGTAAGSTTMKLRGRAGSATSLTIRNDAFTGQFWIKDIGPSGAPA